MFEVVIRLIGLDLYNKNKYGEVVDLVCVMAISACALVHKH